MLAYDGFVESPLNGPNPYAPPTAPDLYEESRPDYDQLLASRGRRLFGSILDGVVYAIGIVPAAFLAPDDDPELALGVFGGLFLLLVAVQAVLVATSGQSIAKKLLGMRIVRTDGSPVGFLRGVLVRSWVFQVISAIPTIGGIIALIDAVYIFGAEHRCMHDMLADTKVVMVD